MQLSMRGPLQRQRQEIRHSEVGSSRFELPRHDLSSSDGDDLQVDQFRRGESVATKARGAGSSFFPGANALIAAAAPPCGRHWLLLPLTQELSGVRVRSRMFLW
jgi:hypothetical protein